MMHRVLLTTLAILVAASSMTAPSAGAASTTTAELAALSPPHGVWVAATGRDVAQWAWTAVPDATAYRVAISRSSTMSSPRFRTVATHWATFTGLTPGASYYVAVRALGADSTSDSSLKVRAVPGAVPMPLGEAVKDFDAVAWRWSRYLGAASYTVQQSTVANFAVNIETHVVTGRTITLGVERDSYGYLRVKALNAAGVAITPWWSPTGSAHVPYHPV